MCMYVFEICAEGVFVTFPWWLENVNIRSKIALFSNERHFEILFRKKRTITFFWSKLSKLHKKDQILHVATTFSLKQGETRTSHGPIPHPLKDACSSMVLQIHPHLFIITSHILCDVPEKAGPGSHIIFLCSPTNSVLKKGLYNLNATTFLQKMWVGKSHIARNWMGGINKFRIEGIQCRIYP